MVPILIQYDEVSGQIDWHRQVLSSGLADISPERFSKCALQKGNGPYLIVLSNSP